MTASVTPEPNGTKCGAGRRHSGPAQRNTGPILEVLRRVLPARGKVLEIASGTGQHVVAFATALPDLQWQPSEPDPRLRVSVELRVADAALENIAPPLDLDVTRHPWPLETADAVLCINMIHIAPWSATVGLLTGAARLLGSQGVLVTYGPYMRGGAHTAPSNADFDSALKARNSEWGVRDIDDVAGEAGKHGYRLDEVVHMPANNFTLVFRSDKKAADT